MMKVFLLGSVMPVLVGSRFPTKGELLRHVLYFKQILSFCVPVAVGEALTNATIFWEKTVLERKADWLSRKDLENWQGLKKSEFYNRVDDS
jgi:hypothetical protein